VITITARNNKLASNPSHKPNGCHGLLIIISGVHALGGWTVTIGADPVGRSGSGCVIWLGSHEDFTEHKFTTSKMDARSVFVSLWTRSESAGRRGFASDPQWEELTALPQTH